MEEFPEGIQFCYSWRSYQAEVLSNLEEHLYNKHLHLVAPPGSGKTVLGLEVMRRLNKATLIVAPTLAIRNQWADRFTELFLQKGERPKWISTDIKNPAFLTITTYQGLFSLLKHESVAPSDEDLDDLEEEQLVMEDKEKQQAIDTLFNQHFQTLILDEAHHLRTSWWKTMLYFRDQLTDPSIVALTATPPYDVEKSEWDRYIELCGPIDEEIDTAALVKEGDLCPHQDYIWMSPLTPKEKEPIDMFHDESTHIKNSLLENEAFKQLLDNHRWMQDDQFIEEKLANYQYFISMMVYLKAVGSEQWKVPFQLVDEKAERLPSFNLEWAETLLSYLFYKEEQVDPKQEPLNSIKKQLSAIKAIEHRKIKLIATRSMERTLLQSASKLDSIKEIVQWEQQSLKDTLRLVVLADYIYKDDLPQSDEDIKPINRLGVIPIFEKLRRESLAGCRLGVLTGSIVIVPREAVSFLKKQNLSFSVNELEVDKKYVIISWKGGSRQEMVKAITAIFSKGIINVLVGTTALLGEGWDAPSVNTLVLASYVGSFMLSNQMRGRAIRMEPGNPEKAANIWHLACMDTRVSDGGYDFQSLKRRFQSLNGVDAEISLIHSGIERLRIISSPFSKQKINENNSIMQERAKRRKRLFDRWQEAVQKGERKREEVMLDKKSLPSPFVFRNTIKSVLVIGASIVGGSLQSINRPPHYQNGEEILTTLLISLVIGLLLSMPWWWKIIKILIFNGTIESRMKQVTEVIYETLVDIGEIKTPLNQNKIIIRKETNGSVYCHLEQGSTFEQKILFQSLQTLVDPIENPRYILHRQSGKKLWIRHDYHAVPDEIGRRKENVEKLLVRWNRRLNKANMVYTRTAEGRQFLLKARMRAMSSKFVPKSKRKSIWK